MDKVTLQLSKFKAANRLTQADHPKIRPKIVHFVQVWVEGSLRLLVVQSLPSRPNLELVRVLLSLKKSGELCEKSFNIFSRSSSA